MTNMIETEVGLATYHLTAPDSDRMKQIVTRIFDMCQDFVEVGLMQQEELVQIVDQSQHDPGFALDYLHRFDDPEL